VTVAALPAATVGTAYSQTATATVTPANATIASKVWSMTATGAAGLSINASSGAITGTATAAGSYTVTCVVTDTLGGTAEGTTELTVSAVALMEAQVQSHYQAVTPLPADEKPVKAKA